MSRTIEAIMRHTTLPSSRATDQSNGVEKLEKEITVKKRHYIWPESRFVRTMLPFHSNIRVGYNGTEVDGKSVLDLMTLAPPAFAAVLCTHRPDNFRSHHRDILDRLIITN